MKTFKFKQQDGFTLLEVLVAFIIAAVALTILMKIFSSGLQLSSRGEDYSRAAILAESLLVRADREFSQQDTPINGIFDDRFNWLIERTPYVLDEEIETDQQTMALTKLAIKVNWQDGNKQRSFNLSSLRLGLKQPE